MRRRRRRGGSLDQRHPGASRHNSSSEEGSLGGTNPWFTDQCRGALNPTPLLYQGGVDAPKVQTGWLQGGVDAPKAQTGW